MPTDGYGSPDDGLLFYLSIAGVLFCICMSCLAAGLTLGILSLDELKLNIKLHVGTDEEKEAAKNILPLLEDR